MQIQNVFFKDRFVISCFHRVWKFKNIGLQNAMHYEYLGGFTKQGQDVSVISFHLHIFCSILHKYENSYFCACQIRQFQGHLFKKKNYEIIVIYYF